jgi:hypothetical protein
MSYRARVLGALLVHAPITGFLLARGEVLFAAIVGAIGLAFAHPRPSDRA